MSQVFEWDELKAAANIKKHGVTFEEAITVFRDPRSMTILDARHSASEERYVDLGRSLLGRVLVVLYTERGEHIRIISCRKATEQESNEYEQT